MNSLIIRAEFGSCVLLAVELTEKFQDPDGGAALVFSVGMLAVTFVLQLVWQIYQPEKF